MDALQALQRKYDYEVSGTFDTHTGEVRVLYEGKENEVMVDCVIAQGIRVFHTHPSHTTGPHELDLPSGQDVLQAMSCPAPMLVVSNGGIFQYQWETRPDGSVSESLIKAYFQIVKHLYLGKKTIFGNDERRRLAFVQTFYETIDFDRLLAFIVRCVNADPYLLKYLYAHPDTMAFPDPGTRGVVVKRALLIQLYGEDGLPHRAAPGTGSVESE